MSKAKGPLCKVCGDEASGFHYGVDSCEGCKGFFRRCITQGMTHRCSNEEKCDMTPFTRNSCQYCRLKKCFAVGMSREASRLGRRPKRIKQDQSEPTSPRAAPSIAPYPPLTQLQISKLSMVELQRLLQAIQTGKATLPPGVAEGLKEASQATSAGLAPGMVIKEEVDPDKVPGNPAPNGTIPESPQVSGKQQPLRIPSASMDSSAPQQLSPIAAVAAATTESIRVSTSQAQLTTTAPVSPSRAQRAGFEPKTPLPSSSHQPYGTIPSGLSPQSNNPTGHVMLPDGNNSLFSAQSSGDYESGYSSGHGGDTPNSATSSSLSPIGPNIASPVVPSTSLVQQSPPALESSPQPPPPPLPQADHHHQYLTHPSHTQGQRYNPPLRDMSAAATYQHREHHSPDSLKPPQGFHNPMSNETGQIEMDPRSYNNTNTYSVTADNNNDNNTGNRQTLSDVGQFFYENAPPQVNEPVHIKQEQLSPPCVLENNSPALQSPAQQQAVSPSSSHHSSHTSPPGMVEVKQEPSPGQYEAAAVNPQNGSSWTPPEGGMIQQLEQAEGASNFLDDSQPQRSLAPKNSLGSLGVLMVEAHQPIKPEKAELLNSVMETIIEAHMNTCDFILPKMEEGMRRYEAVKSQMAAKMDSMMASIDKDPSAMWSKMVDNMVPAITKTVTFSKRLPGFDELTQHDQIKLIKQGSFEVLFVRYTRCLQGDGMLIPTMEFKVPREVVGMMPMGGLFMEMFKFSDTFNPVGLTDAEIGLLTATMIMNADRIGLANRQAVYKLQGLFLQCFYQHLKKGRPDSYLDVFNRVIWMLPSLREINEIHAKHLNNMKMSTPGMNMPDLHEEVFNGKLD